MVWIKDQGLKMKDEGSQPCKVTRELVAEALDVWQLLVVDITEPASNCEI